ncbi:MAG: hypothetical protein ACREQY_15915, partial [Candidatus Binatia bacterium]
MRLMLVVLAAFLELACEKMTRAGLRKFESYSPRLANLDVAQLRVAFQHDTRVQLDPKLTYSTIVGGAQGNLQELHRFLPLVRNAGAATLAGLPPAAKGLTWTVVSLLPEDTKLAGATLKYLLLAPKKEELSESQKRAYRQEFVTLYPRIDFQ